MNHISVSRPLLVMAVVLLVCVIKSQQMRWSWGSGQGRVSRIVLPEVLKLRKKETDLRIVVYTSDKDWAGSNDPVHINIMGTKGETEKLKLDNPGDDFPRAGVDTFKLTTFKIGIPYKIVVWGGESGDSWHLSKIEVEMNDMRYLYESILFDCGSSDDCWFTTTAKTERELTTHQTMIKRKWKVTIYTGANGGAGTHDATWIKFHGNNGSSDFIALKKQGKYMGTKSFIIREPGVWDYIGELSAITMMASRKGDGWQLMRVDAETFIDGKRWVYIFNCGGQWFSRGKTQLSFDVTKKEARFP